MLLSIFLPLSFGGCLKKANVSAAWEVFHFRQALPGFFLCIFSSLTCLKKPVFSKLDLLWWKVPARLYWDLLTSGRYQPACLLKSEKIPALLHVGKGPDYRRIP
jgi:hypothetical protein